MSTTHQDYQHFKQPPSQASQHVEAAMAVAAAAVVGLKTHMCLEPWACIFFLSFLIIISFTKRLLTIRLQEPQQQQESTNTTPRQQHHVEAISDDWGKFFFFFSFHFFWFTK